MHHFIFIVVFLVLTACGDEGDFLSTEERIDEMRDINTEKLIGTPFEGLTTGDSLDPSMFLCGQYRTETIDTFPIPIFAALFPNNLELEIQEGINIANESIGFTAYEYAETWSDDVRVIYAVDELGGNAIGQTWHLDKTFNGKTYSEKVISDWAIEISFLSSAGVIAHELGHATGIGGHYLIDYENDTITELEPFSVMEADGGSAYTDYNFMMQRQGQIMQDHLGESGEIIEDVACPE